MIQAFLTESPRNPMADEASLALLGEFIELEDFKAVVSLASRFAKLYPRSTYLDSFQYSEALGDFHLGEYDRAIDLARAIARSTYKDASGSRATQHEQMAGALHPRPDPRRSPTARQGAGILPAGRRPIHRRRRRDPVVQPQGPEGTRGHVIRRRTCCRPREPVIGTATPRRRIRAGISHSSTATSPRWTSRSTRSTSCSST